MSFGEGFLRQTKVRFIIALIALLSFTVQTYVVQTHIHSPITVGNLAVGSLGASANHKAPTGDKDNPDDCPICQAFAMAGSFVTPALIILALGMSFIDASPFVALRASTGPLLTRNWQSRAPPRR